mmetsp:Transcript_36673/g.72107  ORF Transcript_36673/g.72107 Transcript_36673/m.72107 type:complete len:322 (-) Transcript_36673:940-1905(-)
MSWLTRTYFLWSCSTSIAPTVSMMWQTSSTRNSPSFRRAWVVVRVCASSSDFHSSSTTSRLTHGRRISVRANVTASAPKQSFRNPDEGCVGTASENVRSNVTYMDACSSSSPVVSPQAVMAWRSTWSSEYSSVRPKKRRADRPSIRRARGSRPHRRRISRSSRRSGARSCANSNCSARPSSQPNKRSPSASSSAPRQIVWVRGNGAESAVRVVTRSEERMLVVWSSSPEKSKRSTSSWHHTSSSTSRRWRAPRRARRRAISERAASMARTCAAPTFIGSRAGHTTSAAKRRPSVSSVPSPRGPSAGTNWRQRARRQSRYIS